MNDDDDISDLYNDTDKAYCEGWAFYKADGGNLLPKIGEYSDWIQGFAAGVAEYGQFAGETSLEGALARYEAIKPGLREKLLEAAEQVLSAPSDDFVRWPALPIRAG